MVRFIIVEMKLVMIMLYGFHRGGIAGGVSMTTITMCANSGNIVGGPDVGGIVGVIFNDEDSSSTINSCYNTGIIRANNKDEKGNACVGGIVGRIFTLNKSSTISNCYNTGSVFSSYPLTGGILGTQVNQSGTGWLYMNNCYNVGSVTGTQRIGTMAGYLYRASCSNCYIIAKPGIESQTTVTSDTKSGCKTVAELKGMATTLGSQFKTAPSNVNQGFPILYWQ